MHLGCWDDHTAMADLIASARAGGTGTPPDVDAVNARVTAAHRDASREEVLAALRRNREATARYLAEEPAELDTAPTVSVVGRIPLLSVVLGQAYELAVHGLDLVSCGAAPPPADGAAVRARRPGRRDRRAGRVAWTSPAGSRSRRRTAAGRSPPTPHGWTVRRVAAGRHAGAAVEAPADLLLEAASGRINPVPAVARRRLKVHDIGGPAEAGADRAGGARHPGRADPAAGRADRRRRRRNGRPAVRQGLGGRPSSRSRGRGSGRRPPPSAPSATRSGGSSPAASSG